MHGIFNNVIKSKCTYFYETIRTPANLIDFIKANVANHTYIKVKAYTNKIFYTAPF